MNHEDDQLDLFGSRDGLVRNDHPDTAHQAAQAVAPRTGTLRHKVWEHVKARGFYGATDNEMQDDIPMPANTQRPRRVELVQGGLIADSGRRRRHEGQLTIVWVTADIAEQYRLKGNNTDVPAEP